MIYAKKQSGNRGEDLACDYLKKIGYHIIGRNLANKVGEIDILAQKNEVIVVVEVKTKSGRDFGEGYEMVNTKKRHKLLNLAKLLHIKYPDTVIRIDVISVNLAKNPPEISHFENAVEGN